MRVPEGNVIGDVGGGLRIVGSAFGPAAAQVGVFGLALMRAAFDYALRFARADRRGGPVPIIDHQAVGYALASAKTRIEAVRSLTWRACHALDTGSPAGHELALHAKVFGSETAVAVITDLMQVVGVDSYSHEQPLGRLLQDALALPLFGGSNLGLRRRQLHAMLREPGYDADATVSGEQGLLARSPPPLGQLSPMPVDRRLKGKMLTVVERASEVTVNTVVTFSSLPPSEQFDAWHEAVSKAFVPLDATSRTEGAFGGVLANRAVGAVQFSDVAGGAVDVYRSPQAIRRFDPGYLKLGMQLRGYCLVTQDGREAPLTPGDFALYDTRRPYQLSFNSEFRMLVVMFPHELLNLRSADLAKVVARRVSGRRGVGGLVSPFLVKLANELGSDQIVPTFELSTRCSTCSPPPSASSSGASRRYGPETRRHALILQIKAFIDARLDDPELTTATMPPPTTSRRATCRSSSKPKAAR